MKFIVSLILLLFLSCNLFAQSPRGKLLKDDCADCRSTTFARNTSDGIAQNIVNANLRWQMLKSLYLNFVYEFVSEKRITANRLFVGLSQSF